MKNILLLLFIIGFTQSYSQLQVTQNLSPSQYVSNIIAGSGVSISNVTYTGDLQAIGKFIMNGSSNLGLDSGVLLTTGNASGASGPSNVSNASTNNTGQSDPQLDSLVSFPLNDAAVIEFDFIPISDTIKITYVFGSEEYPEFSLSNFTDVMGLFITGNNPNGIDYLNHNIALIPGTNTPINISTINNGTTNNGPCVNCSYYINNGGGVSIAYDGLTTVLTAWAIVTPHASYHFKIAIADAQDHAYDSGVFIKAGSFKTIDVENPEICNVGIDSSLEYNRLRWSCAESSYIDSFYVYRESALSGNFDLIDSLPFTYNTLYTDSSSNPQQMVYSYKVSAFGEYDFETIASAPHQTMWLNINAGLNNEWELEWSASQGTAKSYYNIYRGTDSLNMQLLIQWHPASTIFIDTNPPTGKVFYQIEADLIYPCYADSLNQTNLYCFSNLVSSSMASNIGLEQSSNKDLKMKLFPSPNDGSFTLEINSSKVKPNQKFNIEIYNILGKQVYQEEVKAYMNLRKLINIDYLSIGVYFLRLHTDDVMLNTKFVLE